MNVPRTMRWGLALALGAACISGLSVFLNGLMVKSFPDPTLLAGTRNGLVGLVFLAISTVVMATGGSLVADSVAMVLYGLGFGLLFPAAAGIVGIAAPAPERGRAYGVFNFSFDAGLSAGPLLAGALA